MDNLEDELENYERLSSGADDDEGDRYKMRMPSLHMSALEIVTHNLDKTQAMKNKDIINKKYVFKNLF
jgi:hypothetical protein